MSVHLDRAMLLLEQSRHDLAQQELRLELGADPDNALAHALLAVSLTQTKQHDEATQEALEAVRLAPDLAYAYYALATMLRDRGRKDEAARAITEAIRLDPDDADYYAMLASLRIDERRWKDALEAAEHGLAVDPVHSGCTNFRALALVQLGRRDEAAATIDTALARDPENAVTHANQGWALLHGARYPEALEHFREALRLDPELEWAREGLVEALKARYRVCGLMLRYFLWMSRLNRGAQWAVLVGAFFGYRLLRDVARTTPLLAPWITPVLIAYGVFVVLTWTARPLFALLLRLNRFGRLVLSREEIVASNWVGATVAVAALTLATWFMTGQTGLLLAALLSGVLVMPLAGIFQCPPGGRRTGLAVYVAVVTLIGLLGLGLSFSEESFVRNGQARPVSDAGSGLLILGIVGAGLGTWISNFLTMVRPRQ